MPTTKVIAGHKVQLPKTFLSKFGVKVGDMITVKEVNGYIILKPLKVKPISQDARTKPTRRGAKEIDHDREEWSDFIAQAFDRSFGDEPAYTSYTIKVPNPEYERR
jgi:bifunctional DNA-binding transcriptional regulator/antitoxin component of YhaV-PrlF toxin-antitoxin module